MAKKMKGKGYEEEEILQLTGLTREELEKI